MLNPITGRKEHYFLMYFAKKTYGNREEPMLSRKSYITGVQHIFLALKKRLLVLYFYMKTLHEVVRKTLSKKLKKNVPARGRSQPVYMNLLFMCFFQNFV